MNPAKLDAALLAAVQAQSSDPHERFSVFVRVDPASTGDAKATLQALGIHVDQATTVCAADLSREQVSDLSDQPWVKLMRLARTARPVVNM